MSFGKHSLKIHMRTYGGVPTSVMFVINHTSSEGTSLRTDKEELLILLCVCTVQSLRGKVVFCYVYRNKYQLNTV